MFLIRSGDLFHNGLGLDPSAWALIEEEACFYKVFSAADKTANRLRNAGLVVTVEMRIPEEKTSDLAGLSENARLKVIALEKALDYYRKDCGMM